MKICIFPNDPIYAYYKKGEIKERYFNPENLFDEIHIISLTSKDIDESKVREIAGKSKLVIHSVGKINVKNYRIRLNSIIKLIKEINPDIIRAYNPLIEGWLAAKCAKNLKIPFYLSLHTQYDYKRKILKKTNLQKYFILKFTEIFIEPFVLKNADEISIVYEIINPYVKKYVNKKPQLIHNKIDCEKFFRSHKIESLPTPLIISVGNLIPTKNHQLIIESMKYVNANLLIIGGGEQFEFLKNHINKLGLENKIKIINSVRHDEIQNYYKSAEIFALAFDTNLEGLPIPVLEAMATGLPVVIPRLNEGYFEGLENVVIFSELNAISFGKYFSEIINNLELMKSLSEKSIIKAKEFDVKIIENKEAKIYKKLLGF